MTPDNPKPTDETPESTAEIIAHQITHHVRLRLALYNYMGLHSNWHKDPDGQALLKDAKAEQQRICERDFSALTITSRRVVFQHHLQDIRPTEQEVLTAFIFKFALMYAVAQRQVIVVLEKPTQPNTVIWLNQVGTSLFQLTSRYAGDPFNELDYHGVSFTPEIPARLKRSTLFGFFYLNPEGGVERVHEVKPLIFPKGYEIPPYGTAEHQVKSLCRAYSRQVSQEVARPS